MSSTFVRLSGLAAMLGSMLWVLWTVGQLQGFGGWGVPGSVAYDSYEFYTRLLPFVLLPVVVGFVGLNAVQKGSYGGWGIAGFLTVLVGFLLVIAGSVGEFWFFSDQPYGMPNGRNASWTLFLLGHPVLGLGTLLFGIATMRAKVFPGDVAALFTILGTCVIVPFLGAFAFALPFVWMGYLLWSGKYEKGQQPSRVR
jgi:hypothetical protein